MYEEIRNYSSTNWWDHFVRKTNEQIKGRKKMNKIVELIKRERESRMEAIRGGLWNSERG